MALLGGGSNIILYPPVKALVLHQLQFSDALVAQKLTPTVEVTQDDTCLCAKLSCRLFEHFGQSINLSCSVSRPGVNRNKEKFQICRIKEYKKRSIIILTGAC